jgi:hypothetical protein
MFERLSPFVQNQLDAAPNFISASRRVDISEWKSEVNANQNSFLSSLLKEITLPLGHLFGDSSHIGHQTR